MDQGPGYPSFSAVTVMSPTSALAVGGLYPCCEAMAQRWDGTAWTTTSTQLDQGTYSYLADVDSSSGSDAWAVGIRSTSPGEDLALTERWNGHRWRIVSNSLPEGVSLAGVAAVTPNNVWAVGNRLVGEATYAPLIAHWDGTRWTTVDTPESGYGLQAVDAVAADDIWTGGSLSEPVMLHWDGTTWTQFPTPLSGARSISSVSSDDVWALGGNEATPEMAHWDGRTWKAVATPDLGRRGGELFRVTAPATDDAWAVGHTNDDRRAGIPEQALIEHWNGHRWAIVHCPHPGSAYDELTAVDASSPDDVWAVGTFSDTSRAHGHRFMLHWDGISWTRYGR